MDIFNNDFVSAVHGGVQPAFLQHIFILHNTMHVKMRFKTKSLADKCLSDWCSAIRKHYHGEFFIKYEFFEHVADPPVQRIKRYKAPGTRAECSRYSKSCRLSKAA